MPRCQALRDGALEAATDEELAAGTYECGAGRVIQTELRAGDLAWLCERHRGPQADFYDFDLFL